MACPRCGCKETYQYDDEDAPDDYWQRCAACGVIFPIEDETPEDDDIDLEPPRPVRSSSGHEYDDDSVCIHCGFDGAEWPHLRRHTHPDDRDPDAKAPLCTKA
jgi:hypothetical protein